MKAIVFDVDDTLYDQVVPFEMACRKVFGERGELPFERIFAASRKYSDQVFEQSVDGRMTMEEMYIYRVKHAFLDYGIVVTDQEALAFQECYSDGQQHISLSTQMKGCLQRLKDRGIPMGIITNGPSKHQWDKIRCLELLRWIPEEFIFVSGDCGVAKPDGRIFARAELAIGVKADELWYVGDSYGNDVVGAKQAGWKCVWFNRRGHAAGGCEPDIVVKDEGELGIWLMNGQSDLS